MSIHKTREKVKKKKRMSDLTHNTYFHYTGSLINAKITHHVSLGKKSSEANRVPSLDRLYPDATPL